MKMKYLLLAGALVCNVAAAKDEVVVNPVTEDGVVKIQWQEPKKYRDLKTANEVKSRFQQRFFDTMTKNINKEAEKILKPEQKLEMVVSDVDLAGDLRPTFGATSASELRIVKDLYPPRMTFSYSITEGEQVIMAGDEKLVDMNFMYGTHSTRNQKPFEYETKMLEDWLKKTVAPKL
ncbi:MULTISPECIES: DUF3016 domain-containing protein [unclassified Shewanella]|uniref:DUF3016 domain-containing protein n=1 Tax=unclassified Shewanella TaxID=196818 RepID=UPI000C825B8F|nr:MULTISPECIES: DUF3016 domain-containing protein [unclassified Shewanella]MDO6620269.1 DUF3016 domain-containing protein [Shewanella sp. 6_MG-2023]MDO6638554.1 DUF3016 domain-containing protein [Shewanella sp. 5_MG-2023]MDO6679547.1 DUF3016 domain-containing protein [Shewanella sp. 4_MG-2023]MDO6774629.1 DUF3016 domain-containing protein [Shewanella sp. 3_MG-2023]PMG32282.1 hypothetical protein BCU94_00740 [Shewanella sp. 10N.286.52.C2]